VGYETIEVTPVTAVIGAQVDGVHLGAIDDQQFTEIHDALLTHLVLFFRDQDITDEQHLAFAARFGTPSVYPIARMLGATKPGVSVIEDTSESPPDADGWHTDVSWLPEPPQVAVLRADVIPDSGGDTLWASLYAAYDRLSPEMQRVCDGLTVHHDQGPEFHAAIERNLGTETADRVAREYPGADHPLVRTHPVTGRPALFVSGMFMRAVVGMNADESEALLAFLRTRLDDPNVQCRWRWRPNDVAVWDERATNHRALSDHYPQYRRMRRITVDG
jgi:taurine dioxygenase